MSLAAIREIANEIEKISDVTHISNSMRVSKPIYKTVPKYDAGKKNKKGKIISPPQIIGYETVVDKYELVKPPSNAIIKYDPFSFIRQDKNGVFYGDAIGILAIQGKCGLSMDLLGTDFQFVHVYEKDKVVIHEEESPINHIARIFNMNKQREKLIDVFICLSERPSIPIEQKQLAAAIRRLRPDQSI